MVCVAISFSSNVHISVPGNLLGVWSGRSFHDLLMPNFWVGSFDVLVLPSSAILLGSLTNWPVQVCQNRSPLCFPENFPQSVTHCTRIWHSTVLVFCKKNHNFFHFLGIRHISAYKYHLDMQWTFIWDEVLLKCFIIKDLW